ncbi:hypothetical protein BDN71DRAFT_1522062 [Pleurotus eryngii]|uniref:Uncharacterized protein n=1 Tax=Pleurotus eryngii TaxID=5323 RepID=A0A9P5ZQ38_PLEER|nr:hypothetical protein BDN71DRAFT_1522062 [Pleurotus eryngii]
MPGKWKNITFSNPHTLMTPVARNYILSSFVNRDMCMHYFPDGGIGHHTQHTQLSSDTINPDVKMEGEERELEPVVETNSDTENESDDSDAGLESDEVDSDEEALDLDAQHGFDSL